MIVPFWGEFSLVPAPLEMSHNYCSHKCAYCFANLNMPGRKADPLGFAKQMATFRNKKDITSSLLKFGMLVTVSNKTDPFAKSNYKISVPQFEIMRDNGIPYYICTRGGDGIDEVIEKTQKSLWYISITSHDDEIRKKVEPGAPSIESRWDLVKKLKNYGHLVEVSCNPYVSKWVDNDEYLKKLIESGADGLVLQRIHLNRDQIGNMSDRERLAMGDVLEMAKKRKHPAEEYDLMGKLHVSAMNHGIKVKNYNAGSYSGDEFSLFSEAYGNSAIFKTDISFVLHSKSKYKDGDIVSFADYYDYMSQDNPLRNGNWPIANYVQIRNRKYRNGVKWPSKIQLQDVYRIFWQKEDLNKQLNRFNFFAKAVDSNGSDVLDSDGNVLFVFNQNFYGITKTRI